MTFTESEEVNSNAEPPNEEERESKNDNITRNAAHALAKTNLLLEALIKKVDRQDRRYSKLTEKYAVIDGASTTPIRKTNREKEVPLQV